MKLVVFGATGGAGRHVVEQALAAGNEVTAVARDPSRVRARERLRVVPGDVGDAASVAAAIAGQDAVYRDKVAAERLVRESEMEWIIIRPPLFGDRSPRGSWRMGEDLDVPMGAMSAADVAGALLQALGEERFLRKAVEIGY
jgi:putative NADH-flavin reductase